MAPFHSFLFLPQSTLLGRSGHTLTRAAKFPSLVPNPAIGPIPLIGSCLLWPVLQIPQAWNMGPGFPSGYTLHLKKPQYVILEN